MKRDRMYRLGLLAGLVATGLTATGCSTPGGAPNNTGTDALAGGAIGAGAGALLGAVTRQPLAGAAIGGIVGAGTGAAIGSNQDRQQAYQANQQATATAIAQAQATAQARLLVPEQVVQMTKSGLSEDIIVNQIRTQGCVQLDQPNLVYLQQSGVSSRVIGEMQAVAARPTPPVVITSATPGAVWDPVAGVYVVRPYGYGYRRYYPY